MKFKTWLLFIGITGTTAGLLLPASTTMANTTQSAFIRPPDSVNLMDEAGKKLSTLPIGTTIEVLSPNASNGQTKIRTSKGREGWVYSRNISTEPPVEELLKKNQEELLELQKQFSQLQTEKSHLSEQLEILPALQESNQKLVETNSRLETENHDLRKTLPGHPLWFFTRPESRTSFILGAGVLFTGFLMGLLITRLSKQRKGMWQLR